MRSIRYGLVCLFASLLLGCSAEKEAAPEPSEPTFLDPQIEALEKAKGVEQMMQEAEQQRAASMDEQGI